MIPLFPYFFVCVRSPAVCVVGLRLEFYRGLKGEASAS